MNQHHPILDPIRFGAAMLVLSFHSAYIFASEDIIVASGFALVRGGWIGVDLFFVISGLVVGMAADRDWRARPKAFRGRFLLRRAARILPLYLVTCVIWLLCVDDGALRGDSWLRQLLSHLTLVHNVWPDTLSAINPPSWSLAHEFQLYVLLIALTPWLARCSPGVILLLSFTTAIVWRCAAYLLLSGQHSAAEIMQVQHFAFFTPGMIDSFGAGVAMMAWHRRGGAIPVRFHGLAWMCLLALLPALWIAGEAHAAISDASIWNQPAKALLLRSFVAVGVALFLLGAIETGKRLATDGAWSRHLGDLSYGIYLWHAIVLLAVARLLDAPIPVKFVVVVLLTLIAAELGLRLIERPILRRARAWLST